MSGSSKLKPATYRDPDLIYKSALVYLLLLMGGDALSAKTHTSVALNVIFTVCADLRPGGLSW